MATPRGERALTAPQQSAARRLSPSRFLEPRAQEHAIGAPQRRCERAISEAELRNAIVADVVDIANQPYRMVEFNPGGKIDPVEIVIICDQIEYSAPFQPIVERTHQRERVV